MVIVQSPEPDCATHLGRVISYIYQHSYASNIVFYKVQVQWWNPTRASKDIKVLYKNWLNRKQQWAVGEEKKIDYRFK